MAEKNLSAAYSMFGWMLPLANSSARSRIEIKQSMNTIAMFGVFLLAAYDCCGKTKAGHWEYQYEVRNPGTRSEFIIGQLMYKGVELPKQLAHVVTPLGEFVFVEKLAWARAVSPKWVPAIQDANGVRPYYRESVVRETLSGKGESFRSTAINVEPASVSGEASISGKLEERPKDVGADWFFAVGQSLWVNPVKMSAVAKDIVPASSPR
jgi:hypothetical protein